jgi:ABC-type phosphate transport system substrate-binding protein
MMKATLARLGGLVVACLIAAPATYAPAANAVTSVKCTAIKGSGSSLQEKGQAAWDVGFAELKFNSTKGELNLESECSSFPSNTYTSTSSGEGLEQFGAVGATIKNKETPFPEFIGDDVGFESTKLKNMKAAGGSNVMSVPVAQSAIAAIVSLPEGCSVKVVNTAKAPILLADNLAQVWGLHLPPNWAELLQNVTFEHAGNACEGEPLRLARASASGTTCGFKRFFADLNSAKAEDNAEWKAKVETGESCLGTAKSQWPEGTLPLEEAPIGGTSQPLKKGSTEVLGVFENPNTIGYADLADAIATGKFLPKGLPLVHSNLEGLSFQSFFVEVGNGPYGSTAKFGSASPEGTHGESNCSKAAYPTAPKVAPGEEWYKVVQSNLEKEEGYPICTLTYDDVWQDYASASLPYNEELAHTTLAFLHYEVTKGQGLLTAKHYDGLPAGEITEAAEKGVTENWHILF